MSEWSLKSVCPWKIGAALSARDIADPGKRALVRGQISSITCENDMKPERLMDHAATLARGDLTRAAINLDVAAPYLDFAMENGVAVRAHTLVWHNQTPRWFFAEGFSQAEDAPLVDEDMMHLRLRHYIADVMDGVNARWPGVVYAWDVVNEAIEPDNGHERGFRMRKSLWYPTLGEKYVEKAFTEARRHAAPGQLLFYNDYLTFLPEKRGHILTLLKTLTDKGLVDGMGMQMHIHPDLPEMSLFEETARMYAALGLTLHLTELDVAGADASTAAQDMLAARYRALVQSIEKLRGEGVNIASVTLWGLTDANCWLTKRDRHCYPMLFDALNRPKPAFYAFIPDAQIPAAAEPLEKGEPGAACAGMQEIFFHGHTMQAAAVPGAWIMAGRADLNAGGVMLRYWSPSAFRVRIVLDDVHAAPAAEVEVPAAFETRRLLLPFDAPVTGEHAVYYVFSDGGVLLEEVSLVPADQMAVCENPMIPMDFPDPDVIRVDDTYYMVTTTMHMMPGCVILESKDLINWRYCTRVYDVLDDTPGQRLENGGVYGKGMWAATLRYHKGTYYVIFVANDTRKTYLFRAEDIRGPWRRSEIAGFFHDCSLLFDDDERVYLAYGNRQIHLTELDADLTGPKPGGLDRIIADSGESKRLGYEGSHLYKIGGKYYLIVIHSLPDRWRRVETCLMADSLEGEFKGGIVFDDDMGVRPDGIAQGAFVDTPDGRWFAILFQDVGAAGRMPYLIPMAWERGMPVIGLNGKTPRRVANLTPCAEKAPALYGSDDFTGPLHPAWEWNHIPVRELTQVGGGELRITTGAVTPVLTDTRNMLTQRCILPACAAEVTLDVSGMQPGDSASLCVLQGRWGMIGLHKEADGVKLFVSTREEGDEAAGAVRAELPWPDETARVALTMRFSAQRDEASFAYQQNGEWVPFGPVHPLVYLLDHFMGARFGLAAQSAAQSGGTAVFTHFVFEHLEG